MCGIAGYAGLQRDPLLADADLRAMCGAIRHRGPDDEGRYASSAVALGMRRLSIIDVAGGHQPMRNEDESILVVFNGEIYNYRQLRARLESAGHRLATHSDTETLVHLYEDDGDRLVHALRGMFGFAIWDSRRERLLLGRDRLGIKPLYYWETNGGVAFASELKSFLALEDFPRRIDGDAMARYLALGYVPDPHCIYEGVRKLPPGHTLSWDRAQGCRVERYWSPVVSENRGIDEETAVTELRRLLADAVECHLESEVPLGAFLSGGLDSSSVVAQMRLLLDRPVRTFSIGFDEPEFDETPHAAAVARALGTDHTQLIVRPDADALIDDVVRAYDEPFADSSALPMMLVSRLARQHVTVALSGDGGDELFGGYTRYTQVLGKSELAPRLRQAIGGFARRLPHVSPGRGRLVDLSRSMRGRYTAHVSAPLAEDEGGVLRAALTDRVGGMDDLLGSWFDEASSRDFLTQMTLVDLMTYLPGDILTKVDRASMAVSLEARVPLLDHHLVEFAISLPDHLKVRDAEGKWILRKAVAGLVPSSVLSQPKKGFAVPLRHWFRRELRYRIEALNRPDARILEYVEPRAVSRLVSEHLTRRRDHSAWLWRLIVLELWLASISRTASRGLAATA